MYFICRTSEYFHKLFVCIVIFVHFVNGIPHNQHKHNYSWTFLDEDIVLKSEWVNPCCSAPVELFNQTEEPPRNSKLLKPLRDSLQNFIVRLNGPEMHAINTSDISDWFKYYNSTYEFLRQINVTAEPINLPKRHLQTQIYIGAFQFLATKQKDFDFIHNEGNDVTIEIFHLLILAKNLLCEIETVITNAGRSIPMVFSRERMGKLLNFRNNNSINQFDGDINELNNKFAKVRFHEYVHNLRLLLNGPYKHNVRQRRSLREKLRRLNRIM